jgi:uncharacterized RDD family membrane protein YckC
MGMRVEYASFWRRLGAYLLDVIPISLLVLVIFVVFLGFGETYSQYAADPENVETKLKFLMERNNIRDLAFLIWLIYGAALEGSFLHGTLGKRALGIAVVDEEGYAIPVKRAITRNSLKIVSLLPLGLGFLWAAFSKAHATWHDRLAKTRVIRRRRGEPSLDLQPGFDDDLDLSWLDPPADPLDVGAWNQYWLEQVGHGIGPPILDMFCDDRELVELMKRREMKSVLCAGSGISQEPRALAEAGFEVVALDFSPQAIEIAKSFDLTAEGFEYFCDPGSHRPGGRVEFVVGDILDKSVCPGPFDVIIERRTAQTYLDHNLGAVMTALADRLACDGIFLSHCHDGCWRPPAMPRHFTEPWFRENGWTVWSGDPDPSSSGRVAWLLTTTG